MSKYPPMKLEWTFRFGMHKGQKVWEVLETDPKWIQWAIANIGLELDDEAFEMLSRKLPKE